MTSQAPQRPGQVPASKSRLADVTLRLVSAVVMATLALATLLYSGQAFVLFWLVAAILVHWEWQHMLGTSRVLLRCAIGTAALALAAALARSGEFDLPLLALAAGSAALAATAVQGRRLWSAMGLVYAGALIIALCVLRFSNPDMFRRMVILWLFAVVWGTDVMAYFGGRLIGGPKLWTVISPSKTWSGTLTGIVSGALLGTLTVMVFARFVGDVPHDLINYRIVFVLGLVMAFASQAGDLVESAVKRRFGLKDSSRLIPGHGGFMDRLDGFIVAAALAAAIGSARLGPNLAVSGLFLW